MINILVSFVYTHLDHMTQEQHPYEHHVEEDDIFHALPDSGKILSIGMVLSEEKSQSAAVMLWGTL